MSRVEKTAKTEPILIRIIILLSTYIANPHAIDRQVRNLYMVIQVTGWFHL